VADATHQSWTQEVMPTQSDQAGANQNNECDFDVSKGEGTCIYKLAVPLGTETVTDTISLTGPIVPYATVTTNGGKLTVVNGGASWVDKLIFLVPFVGVLTGGLFI
jgi:hypothetical protein